jgi:hypothetical protein
MRTGCGLGWLRRCACRAGGGAILWRIGMCEVGRVDRSICDGVDFSIVASK